MRICKNLLFKENSLFIKGKEIFKLKSPENNVQEYLLRDSLHKLSLHLQKSDRKYISECVNTDIVRENDYIILTLYCENSDGKYKKTYGFFMSDYSFQFVA